MQLLQHFKELTLRPKNAQELKGLILQLAIQGKLTANWRNENPDIEPASELLKRIQKEKEQLVKDKKIKKEKALSKVSKGEIAYKIPKNWVFTRLGIYTHNFGQKTPDRNFEYIDVASIDNQLGIIRNDLNILNPDEAPSRARKIVQKGCVIYSTVRPYLLNIACVDRDFENEAIASTAFSILNPLLDCSPFYLYHLLRSFYFIEYVNTFSKGVAYPAINDKNLLNAPIPIPPLQEQKEIVKVVETLFKEVEQLEQLTVARIGLKEDYVTSALQQLTTNNTNQEWTNLQDHFKSFFNETTNIKKLRETILQLAVQGKLTADWRSSHPELVEGSNHASNLLKRIQKEKTQLIKDKKIKKEKALPPITEDEIPYTLPDGWVWCRIREVSYSIVPNRDKPKSFSGDITWLTTRNLERESNIIHAKETDNKLTMEEVESYNARLLPRYSVIMSCVGQFGLSAILDKEYSCNQQLHCFVPLCDVSPYYLDYLVKNGKGVYEDMSSATTIAYLNKTKCDSLPISLPPLEEQKAIVEKVNVLMGLCDALEQEVQQSQQHSEMMMQSVLKEVFEGGIKTVEV